MASKTSQRGLLEEILVVWGGEFGRTPMQENREGIDVPFIGRDHHIDAYIMWMAGGGIKGGISYGETDVIGFHGIKDQVHVHDLQAHHNACSGNRSRKIEPIGFSPGIFG